MNIFYLHIPKTGGSTLNKFISQYYREFECLLHAESKLDSLGSTHEYQFISGHLNYYQAKKLIDLKCFKVITIFRTPFQHLVSHVNWVVSISSDIKSQFFMNHPKEIQELSLEMRALNYRSLLEIDSYFGSLKYPAYVLFNNNQLRYLVENPHKRLLDENDLESGCKVLKCFDMIGTLETFHQFKLDLASQYFSAVQTNIDSIILNPCREKHVDINVFLQSPSVRELIKFDELLYDRIISLK